VDDLPHPCCRDGYYFAESYGKLVMHKYLDNAILGASFVIAVIAILGLIGHFMEDDDMAVTVVYKKDSAMARRKSDYPDERDIKGFDSAHKRCVKEAMRMATPPKTKKRKKKR
jgi:hypothetical protein